MSQGIANITGLQKGFNWRSVAASGVGAAAGSVAAGALQGDNLLAKITAGNELAQRSAVGFIAGTATALARGGKIDVVTIATDAFGNALGESLKDQIHSSFSQSSGTSGGGSQGGMGAYVGPEDEDSNAIGPNPGNTRDRSRFTSTSATSAKEEARYKQELAAQSGWYDDGLVCKPIRSIDDNGQRLVNATGDGLSGAQRYLRDNGFTDPRAGTLTYDVGRHLIEDIGLVGSPFAMTGLLPAKLAIGVSSAITSVGNATLGETRMLTMALSSEIKAGLQFARIPNGNAFTNSVLSTARTPLYADTGTIFVNTPGAMGVLDDQISFALQGRNSYGVLASSDQIADKVLEGRAAFALRNQLVAFDRTIPNSAIPGRTGQRGTFAQVDLETPDAIIEVTNATTTSKATQIRTRLTNPAVNPDGKPVVVLAPGYGRSMTKSAMDAGASAVVKTVPDLVEYLRTLRK
ncbi:hypothetical protein [Massilia sp. YIM B04103]|uniref:hypothetical protein n=1 Tax=Massilia sp. YIM B04103 TaxID=2963106 RepID=UPI002109D95E|nr:hypothetical protein [Massilia sp. YIM B04103]